MQSIAERIRAVLIASLFITTTLAVLAGPAAAADPVACGTEATPTAITLGVSVLVNVGVDDCFLSVPLSGDLTGKRLSVIAATSEDHDLYIGRGVAPTAATSSCTYLGNGRNASAANETCILQWPLFAGDYVVRVHRVGAGSNDVTITPNLTSAPSGSTTATGSCIASAANTFNVIPLTSNLASSSAQIGLAVGSRCVYSYAAPAGLDAITAVFSALTTSGYVSLRHDYPPSPTVGLAGDNDCSQQGNALGAATSCTKIFSVDSSVWYLAVDRVTAVTSTTAQTMRAIPYGCGLGRGVHPLGVATNSSTFLYQGISSACYFSIPHDEGKSLAKVTMSPVGANFDLRMRRDAVPNTTVSDCASTIATANVTETCSLRWSGSTSLVAMVNRPVAAATGSGTHNFSIETSSVEGCSLGQATTELMDSVDAVGTLTNDSDAACFFSFLADPEASVVRVTVTPPASGLDPNLYVSPTALPILLTGNACSSALANASAELCEIPNPGTPVYSMVRRANGTGDFTIRAIGISPCSLGGGDVELLDAIHQLGSLTADVGGKCNFYIDVPATADTASVTITPPVGSNFDVSVRKGARPTASAYDCRSTSLADAADSCAVTLGSGRYYVQVQRIDGSGEFDVVATAPVACSGGLATIPVPMGSSLDASLLDSVGASCAFVMELSPDADAITATLTPASGNFDLYLRKGSAPTTTAYDCRSNLTGTSVEACTSALESGTYYAKVQRSSGGGSFTLAAAAVTTCSHGVGSVLLTDGALANASLLDLPGAKCYFRIQPPNPFADPMNPGKDLATFSLSTDASKNFDIYVQKNATPSTSSYACRGITNTTTDSCKLVFDGSPYYVMVRRTSGSGDFSALANVSSSCSLGEGMHDMSSGESIGGTVRAVAGGKCYFKLASKARDDLLSIGVPAPALNTYITLAVRKDGVPGTPGANDCGGTAYNLLNLFVSAYQCDKLLEDGLPHTWYSTVAWGTLGADPSAFSVTGTAMSIPTLLPGLARVGRVDVGTTQYYKVRLPENATHLTVATAGDVSGLGCGMGSGLHSVVALGCILAPLGMLLACPIAAAQTALLGIAPCAAAEYSGQQACQWTIAHATNDSSPCAAYEAQRAAACAATTDVQPTCGQDTRGGLANTCLTVNRLAGTNKCNEANIAAKFPQADLYLRYREGLPTTSLYQCRSNQYGASQRCTLDARLRELHDNTTEPARATINQNITAARALLNENRPMLDQILAGLWQSATQNRSTIIEPNWSTIRAMVFSQTGTDPGALPPTPSLLCGSLQSCTATPGASAPDQFQGQALPAQYGGKWFIAVKGPSSGLTQTGADYAIVASYDALPEPTQDDLVNQLPSDLQDAVYGVLGKP